MHGLGCDADSVRVWRRASGSRCKVPRSTSRCEGPAIEILLGTALQSDALCSGAMARAHSELVFPYNAMP